MLNCVETVTTYPINTTIDSYTCMLLSEERMLRSYIRMILAEDGWEDPHVVYAADHDEDDDDPDEEPDPADVESGSTYKLRKTAEDNLNLHQRANYSKDNVSMASMKPIAPKRTGGPASGRSPGGKVAAPVSRNYSSGY